MTPTDRERIEVFIKALEQVPVLRISFGGRDAETGYQVVPEMFNRNKVIAMAKALLQPEG